jgi:hypothetical protein
MAPVAEKYPTSTSSPCTMASLPLMHCLVIHCNDSTANSSNCLTVARMPCAPLQHTTTLYHHFHMRARTSSDDHPTQPHPQCMHLIAPLMHGASHIAHVQSLQPLRCFVQLFLIGRRASQGAGRGLYNTAEAVAAFHVNRLDWVYSYNASWVHEATNVWGLRAVSLSMNANLPDTPTSKTSTSVTGDELTHGDTYVIPYPRSLSYRACVPTSCGATNTSPRPRAKITWRVLDLASS